MIILVLNLICADVIRGDSIVACAVNYVRSQLPWGEWSIVPLNTPPSIFLSGSSAVSGFPHQIAVELPSKINLKGATLVWVKIAGSRERGKREEGREKREGGNNAKLAISNEQLTMKNKEQGWRKIPVSLKVREKKLAVVADRRIAKGEILKKEFLKVELREIAKNGINKIEEVVGLRARKVIAGEQVLTKEMVEEVPVVKKGERVNIIFKNKGIVISTNGISMCDGWINDIIGVTCSGWGKLVEAKVMGEKEVILGKK